MKKINPLDYNLPPRLNIQVNKKMKTLNKIFYDILLNLDKEKKILFQKNTKILEKYFFMKNNVRDNRDNKVLKLAEYLRKFQNFCFDLDINIMLNGSIDFKYR